MADKPVDPAPVYTEQVPAVAGSISAIASANAPFIYFDGVPNFGFNNGIANLSLEILRFNPVPGSSKVLVDRVTVAHLRMNLAALKSLKDAIAGIELMAEPVPDDQKN